MGLCHDQARGLAHIHQRPPLRAGGHPVPLLPAGPPVSGSGGAQVSAAAPSAPALLPQPPALPALHARLLPVLLLLAPP